MASKSKCNDGKNPLSHGKYPYPVADPDGIGDENYLLNQILAGKPDNEITFDYVQSNYPGPLSEIPTIMTDGAFLHFMPTIIQWCSLPRPEVDCLAESVLFRLHRDCLENRELVQAMTIEHVQIALSFIQEVFWDQSNHSWSYPKQVKLVLDSLAEQPPMS